ncbi:MAG: hypothetical protein IJ390_01610 [Lachnospiraceae bacterium]|nr:hypothetical protein [Lachnospiraceae bacterium]
MLRKILHDLVKVFIIGILAALAVSVLLFGCGFLFGGFEAVNALEVAKNGLLIIASLGLFIVAGMLLTKGKKAEKFSADNGWRDHFSVIGPKTAIGVLCAAFLAAASAADYLWMILK